MPFLTYNTRKPTMQMSQLFSVSFNFLAYFTDAIQHLDNQVAAS